MFLITYCSNLYCSPMWFDGTRAALKKLKITYNSLQRFMFWPWRNSATEMFVNLGIHSFDEMLRIFLFSFCFRVTAVFIENCGHVETAYYIYSQRHYLSYAPAL